MTKAYTRTHPLRWPLDGLTTVTISTISIGLMRDLRAKFKMDSHVAAEKDGHGFAVAVFLAHTGLTEQQRGDLTKPDLNSITQHVHELAMKSSSELVNNTEKADADQFTLLVPVADPIKGPDPVTVVTMRPPTVRLTDSVRELGEFDQERELVATCTDLMPGTVMKLHMPDWLALQRRLNDFLEEPADYFPLQTSNA
ncbi:phage tail assembly protein [Aeromonas veronii]|uniref:phage tail assembly protein n=1 Tax=Aeromonas veronii TaxID=654 RepID=UPI000F8D822A|nr:phage tail assembly protein [Aeromonas veronii]RUR51969.1 phage tail assembly protein [Aeromonas veronii]